MTQGDHLVHILLIEDNTLDVRMVQRALQKKKITNPMTVAADGMEGLEILRGSGGSPPLPRPYLILLDLNMPRMDGIQFLEELRRDTALTDSIVFVLTSSELDQDVTAAYAHHIAGYISKANVGKDFMILIELVEHMCLTVHFPPAQHQPAS